MNTTKPVPKTINIDFRSADPVEQGLSNLYPRTFTFQDVECGSMEGFLQSLKYKDPDTQAQICKLSGFKAKKAHVWWNGSTLFWQGTSLPRHREQYIIHLRHAYVEMFRQNEEALELLKGTKDAILGHSIGHTNPKETILTRKEFTGILTDIRGWYHACELLQYRV